MRGAILALLIAACAPSVTEAPEAAAPPPVRGLERVAVEQVDGMSLRFHLRTPRDARGRLRLFAALQPAPGACNGGLPGVCVALDQPYALVDVDIDPSGRTLVEVPWKVFLAGQATFYTQAAAIGPNGRATVSAVWTERVLPADDDRDADGLLAADEHAAFSRTDRPDTDGGGTLDGQEVADGTDPTDPIDDRGVESGCANGLDDDQDALADCEDADCVEDPVCDEVECADNLDNDGDGTLDCDDPDCWTRGCLPGPIAWTLEGEASTYHKITSEEHLGWFHRRGAATGKVVKHYPASIVTCTWSAQAGISYYGNVLDHPSPNRRELRYISPPCQFTSDFLPPVDVSLWDAGQWYGMHAPTTNAYLLHYPGALFLEVSVFRNESRPNLNHVAYGDCSDGTPPQPAFYDADGDGFGISDRFDLHGTISNRTFVCGPLEPGMTLLGGDCDDSDPAWHPGNVILAPGTICADLSPTDRDGDGVSPPTDLDDLNIQIYGQEFNCSNGVDDNLNGLVDCEDDLCAGGPGCTELDCEDRRDNDQDGLIDCQDEDCWINPCFTERVISLTTADVHGRYIRFSPSWSSAVLLTAENPKGRVRITDPAGTRTCTWSATRSRFADGFHTFFTFRGGTSRWRQHSAHWEGFYVTPGCDITEEDLPQSLQWSPYAQKHGWYTPLVANYVSSPSRMTWSSTLTGGPNFEGEPLTDCIGAWCAARYLPDADGDGFGVSDAYDRQGEFAGWRFTCGQLPPGSAQVGGDCDDQDPTWNPTTVTLAPNARCTQVQADDLDADGVLAPADPNDRDGNVR